MMPEKTTDSLFRDFGEALDRFLASAPDHDVKTVFPGWEASPADCLFPSVVSVDRPYSIFRVRAGREKPVSLCFSKIIFIGHVIGSNQLQDVSSHASFEQSSQNERAKSAEAGVSGKLYSNNIHTLKQSEPWWKATFPKEIRVKFIYFYRRCDWHVIHDKDLRITAAQAGRVEETLFYPGNPALMRASVQQQVAEGVAAFERLLPLLEEGQREQYSEWISDAFKAFGDVLRLWQPDLTIGGLEKVRSLFGSRQEKHIAPKAVDALTREQRAGIADNLLKALELALGKAKDFGLSPKDGLEISVPSHKIRYLRFRTYGELPPGLGGAELYAPDEQKPLMTLTKEDLKFRYLLPAFQSPGSFRIGLRAEIRSRRVDLGASKGIDRLRVWNINKQHAANTLFLEIAARNEADEPWTVIYDHGAPYRHVCAALGFINILVSSSISPVYARLLGKMFTQYRRRQFMDPVARLFRHREQLNKAVFEGSNQIAPQTRFAAPLRLGKHGLGVPVAFRNQDVIMKHLVEMRDKIRDAGFKPLFMYGTLLGAIREKDFIPHDDDVDLAIIMDGVGPEELNTECDQFIELLNGIGIKASRGAPHSPLIHCHRGPITYDIFLIGHVGDKVFWPHKHLKLKEEPADIFLPTGMIEFKGEIFDAPRNPEAVCEARYGKDWHIPNPAFEW